MRAEREGRAAPKASGQTEMKAPRQVPEVSHDEIARRAYQRYEQRGAMDGHDLDDWLAAEQELSRERKTDNQPTPRPKLAKPSDRLTALTTT